MPRKWRHSATARAVSGSRGRPRLVEQPAQLQSIGVTDAIVVPRLASGASFGADLEIEKAALHRFAEKVIAPLAGG